MPQSLQLPAAAPVVVTDDHAAGLERLLGREGGTFDSGSDNGYFMVTKLYRPDEVHERQGAGRLSELLTYWRDLGSSIALPNRLDPEILDRIGILPNVHLVNTAAGRPEGYEFRYWGPNSRFLGGMSLEGWQFGDFDNRLYRMTAMYDYFNVVETGEPRFQFLHTTTPLGVSNRWRLLLPVASRGGRTDRVYSATQFVRLELL